MVRRMGSIGGLVKLIPGLGKQLEGLDDVDEKQFARVEAIVLSMTPQERALPKMIDGSRRKRIAGGSGTTVEEVNRLLEGRKEMEKLMKTMGKGNLPQLPGAPAQAPKRKATKSNKRKKRSKTRR
jgi:signal recognition particle subunit SRP54